VKPKVRAGRAVRILSIDDGYPGLAMAPLMERVDRHFGRNPEHRFDLFSRTSVSVSTIVALGLAAGRTSAQLRCLRIFTTGKASS